MVGRKVKINPSLVRQIIEEGHDVENHTFSHSRKYNVSLKTAEQEIKTTNELIFRAARHKPRFFRPPYGYFNYRYIKAARENGLEVVFWTVDAADFKSKKIEEFVSSFLKKVNNGSILLFHQGDILKPNFANALYKILKKLTSQGFVFKKISTLQLSQLIPQKQLANDIHQTESF